MADSPQRESWQPVEQRGPITIVKASPPMLLASGFLVLIGLGTLLLSLPLAATPQLGTLEAFFMATSAVTVTGLAVVDTANQLTGAGQALLISLVQLGGLGFVTFAVLTSLALGKKLSIRQQAVALQAFNQTNISRIRRTARAVLEITLVIEGCAAVLLTLWWWQEMPFASALKYGVFHAVAAFNNAGFSLFNDSLQGYANDAVIIMSISMLIVLGGIGFSVLGDLLHKKRWTGLMPYTKVIILGTLILSLLGFIAILLLEHDNPNTLGHLPWHGKVLSSWMQSITARTAGFTTFDVSQLNDSSTLLLLMLMFIGGGSLSTASGIKIGTFIILMAAMWSYVCQSREVTLMRRSIEPETIQKSLALVVVTTLLAMLGLFLLTLFESKPFIDLVFEAISALSTTGMTRGVTTELSVPGQFIIIVMMFAGRLGPLTLVYSLATRRTRRIRYPIAEFPVG